MEFVETPTFTKQIIALLSEEQYRQFQTSLAANPGRGSIIRGGGGLRKVRVGVDSRGKRGGARVIYYWAVQKDLILLLFAFPKNVASDLTARQRAELALAAKEAFSNE